MYGSFWNYEATDEIKGTKWIYDTLLTETAENERVLRGNTRGVNNPQITVYDRDWNEIQTASTKYEPSRT